MTPAAAPSEPLGTSDPAAKDGSSLLRNPTPSTAEVIADATDALDPQLAADESPTIISRNRQQPAPTDPTANNALFGRRLAHFELIAPVGVGGMAAVLRARDTLLDRSVALKILPPEMANNVENVRRFQQEARAAAKLDHENIARVFYCGEDQRLHFIAFEFVEGENLRTVLEKRGRLPVGEAVNYTLQIAHGLAHAASRGVVHRDIKPSNIIVTPEGKAKLVDMGLARSLAPHGNEALTQSGVTLGTFDYISPEQALEPRDADVRSDIYSLGCTFYHMLTGQPPVPEGTAAKKLHHHEKVHPTDPRVLNPEVPNEVAAVLHRMMAKDPKERYQKPEELELHLLHIARDLGVADVPDYLMYTNAPLPSPPRAMPLWLSGLAAVGLIGLLILLEQAPPDDDLANRAPTVSTKDEPPPTASAAPSPPATVPTATRPTEEKKTPPASPTVLARSAGSARDLAAALQSIPAGAAANIDITGDIDLNDLLVLNGPDADSPRAPSLTVQDRKVTMRGTASQRPRLRLTYNAATGDGLAWAALTIRGGDVELRDLRLEVDATAADILMSALAVRDGAKVKLTDCEFVQIQVPMRGLGRLSSIEVDRSAEAPPSRVEASGCHFSGGQDAIGVTGPVELVQLKNCSFGRHAALVHLRGASRPQDSKIMLDHCSAHLGGPAIRLDQGSSAQLIVSHSLFARPNGIAEPEAPPMSVVWQLGKAPVTTDYPPIDFAGRHNVYHQLDGFWYRSAAADERPEPVADFLQARQGDVARARDTESIASLSPPWRDAIALAKLDDVSTTDPRRAFAINVDLPDLRLADAMAPVVGVVKACWGQPYDLPLKPLTRPSEAVARIKVVDPDASATGNGIFRFLSQAVAEAQPGDTILIKQPRGKTPLVIEPIRLERSTSDLTIKPYDNQRVTLTLGDTADQRPALFHVHDGLLRLEGLELQLRPRPGFLAQAVVQLAGVGHCTLKDCSVTLDVDGRDIPLAAVAFADPARVMKMGPVPPRPLPEIRFEGCLVRGTGSLLMVGAGQAFDLRAHNVLAVLAGSLLDLTAKDDDAPLPPATQINLSKVTACLTEHLLVLHSNDDKKLMRGMSAVHVSVGECLTVSPGSQSKSLIHLTGLDGLPEEKLKQLLVWSGRANIYSGFMPMLDQQPRDDGMALSLNRVSWEAFAQSETAPRYDKMTFAARPERSAYLRAVPSQFRVTSEPSLTTGAEIEALVKQFAALESEEKKDELTP
jgi:serine/threonine protein kinase